MMSNQVNYLFEDFAVGLELVFLRQDLSRAQSEFVAVLADGHPQYLLHSVDLVLHVPGVDIQDLLGAPVHDVIIASYHSNSL